MADASVQLRPQLPKAPRKKRQKLDERLSEREKNSVRRNNNRQAAQNLRNRKKNYESTLETQVSDLREENVQLEARAREMATFQEDLRNKIRIISAVVERVQAMEEAEQQQQQQQQKEGRELPVDVVESQPSEDGAPSPVPQLQDVDAATATGSPGDSASTLLDDQLSFSLACGGDCGGGGFETEGLPFDLVPLDASDARADPIDDLVPGSSSSSSSNGDICTGPAFGMDGVVPGAGVPAPQQGGMSGSDASLESAAFKRSPLPSELQNLSALCCILGITSFLNPPPSGWGQAPLPSSAPLPSTSPVLNAPPSDFGLPEPSTASPPVQGTTDTGFLNPLLALADPARNVAMPGTVSDFITPYMPPHHDPNPLLCV